MAKIEWLPESYPLTTTLHKRKNLIINLTYLITDKVAKINVVAAVLTWKVMVVINLNVAVVIIASGNSTARKPLDNCPTVHNRDQLPKTLPMWPIVLLPPRLTTPVQTRAAETPPRLSSPSAAQTLILKASTTAVKARSSIRQAMRPPTLVVPVYPLRTT